MGEVFFRTRSVPIEIELFNMSVHNTVENAGCRVLSSIARNVLTDCTELVAGTSVVR